MKSRVRHILFFTFMLLIAAALQSCDTASNVDQPGTFYKYIGNEGNQFGIDLVTDADDNIYVLGATETTTDGLQIYLVKTNSDGIVLWEQTYGGDGNETPKDIELTANGVLAVLADTDVNGEKDYVIYMVSPEDGSLTMPPKADGLAGRVDVANSITPLLDGGYIVASSSDNGTYKDGYTRRYTSSMEPYPFWNPLLDQLAGGGGFDIIPVKVIQFSEGIFYTFGHTNSIMLNDDFSDYNIFGIVSPNDNSPALQVFVHPGPERTSNERLTSVRPFTHQFTSGYILAGYTSAGGSNTQDLYMMHIRQNITELKPSQPSTYLQGTPTVVTSDLSAITDTRATVYPSSSASEGFMILGEQTVDGNRNIYLKKVNDTFADAWQDPHTFHVFGGGGDDRAGAVVETADGKILVCGTMTIGELNGQSKIVLMKLSPEGMFNE